VLAVQHVAQREASSSKGTLIKLVEQNPIQLQQISISGP